LNPEHWVQKWGHPRKSSFKLDFIGNNAAARLRQNAVAMPPTPQKKRQDDPLIHKEKFRSIAVIFRNFASPFLLEKNKVQLQVYDISGLAPIKSKDPHRRKRRGQLGK
jgi:hypothetical protein